LRSGGDAHPGSTRRGRIREHRGRPCAGSETSAAITISGWCASDAPRGSTSTEPNASRRRNGIPVGGHLAIGTPDEQRVRFPHPGPDTRREPRPVMPRYRGLSFGKTSPRRHEATTGTEASPRKNQGVRAAALRTPAPADDERPLRIQQQMQDLSDQSRVRLGWVLDAIGPAHARRRGQVSNLGTERSTGPGRPFSAVALPSRPAPPLAGLLGPPTAHFTIGSKVRTRSISWKASRPRTSRSPARRSR